MKSKILVFITPTLLFFLTACTPSVQQTVTDTLTSDTETEPTQETTVQDQPMEEISRMNDEGTMVGQYSPYSKTAFDQVQGKKRVLFFHASWCPTCKAANQEFTSQANQLPSDVVVFKTDYDTEKELKQKYGITYQHTFVLVDKDGNEITKWNGGGIEEILSKI